MSLDRIKDLEDDEVPMRFRDHALFAAYAPAGAPEISIAVIVEHAGAGGGRVAAPIAQRVLARFFEKRAQRIEAEAEAEAERTNETPSGDSASTPSLSKPPAPARAGRRTPELPEEM